MRTTITLDPDTEELVRQRMRTRRCTFKEAVNDAIRAGLGSNTRRAPFRTQTADMGLPTVNLDRALALAGELEDEEILRKQRARK